MTSRSSAFENNPFDADTATVRLVVALHEAQVKALHVGKQLLLGEIILSQHVHRRQEGNHRDEICDNRCTVAT